MRFFSFAFTVLLIIGRCGAAAESVSSVKNTVKLFNGRDLSGFYTWLVDTKREDPREVFTVTNNMIRISGKGLGYLATDVEYGNFHLVAEFRWGTHNWSWGDRIGKARDSGIFLHATGPDGNSTDGKGAFMAAIECNVFQGATGDFLLIRGADANGELIAPQITATVAEERDADGWFTWQPQGRQHTIKTWGRLNWVAKDSDWKDQLEYRGPHDLESHDGGWTKVECICDEDRITIKVNGVVANQASGVFPSQGKILFQCEGSEIFWRRLELHPIRRVSTSSQVITPQHDTASR